MAHLTYNPDVFRVPDIEAAKRIILTPEGGQTTQHRWETETPYLAELLCEQIRPTPDDLVVDFGCGIGRMARALIERSGCRVLGVDISQEMRGMAPAYVGSPAFSVVSSEVFAGLVARGLRVDAVISVWVLQHCLDLPGEIALIREALKPGGRLAVVNNIGRAVPTREKPWANDGLDIRELLGEALTVRAEGQLDAAYVGEMVRRFAFWGAYTKA